MHPIPSRRSGGYPLIALFLVITACGIVAALIGPLARAVSDGRVGVWDVIAASVISTVVVTLIGGVIGMFHYRRMRGLLWGLLAGAVIGVFVGPLVLAPREAFGTVLSLSFGGATVIVLISVAFCIASRK